MATRSYTATATATDRATGVAASAKAGFSVVTTPPSRAALHVGCVAGPVGACPNSLSAWTNVATPALAPPGSVLDACKVFHTGKLPASYAGTEEAGFPDTTLRIVCYKTQTTNVAAYVNSIPPNLPVPLVLVYFQEPENDMPGATFKAQAEGQFDLIHAQGNPSVLTAMDAEIYAYGAANLNSAQSGAFITDPAKTDVYLADVYQHTTDNTWSSAGLSNYPPFQNWWKLVRGLGRPWGLAEYGIDSCDETKRQLRLQQDAAYLRTLPQPLCWCYWWTNCNAGTLSTDCHSTNQFTDPTTLNIFGEIVTGAI